MKRLQPLSKLLYKKSKSSLAKPIQASMILDKFNKICEQILDSKTNKGKKIVSINNKTLKIKCENQLIAQEIKLKEKQLIDELNKECKALVAEKLAIF